MSDTTTNNVINTKIELLRQVDKKIEQITKLVAEEANKEVEIIEHFDEDLDETVKNSNETTVVEELKQSILDSTQNLAAQISEVISDYTISEKYIIKQYGITDEELSEVKTALFEAANLEREHFVNRALKILEKKRKIKLKHKIIEQVLHNLHSKQMKMLKNAMYKASNQKLHLLQESLQKLESQSIFKKNMKLVISMLAIIVLILSCNYLL